MLSVRWLALNEEVVVMAWQVVVVAPFAGWRHARPSPDMPLDTPAPWTETAKYLPASIGDDMFHSMTDDEIHV